MKKLGYMATILAILPAVIYMSPELSYARPKLDNILEGMQKRYQSIETYQTAFEQTLASSVFKKVIRHATGTIYYAKPGKIRWVYDTPEKRVYVIDGENFWDYDEEQNQVIKIPVKQALAGSSPQGFLFGAGNFKKDFDVKLKDYNKSEPHRGYLLAMTPKDKNLKATLSDLELLISDKDYRVKEAKFIDAQGNTNHYAFTNSAMNPPLDPELFVFKVPDGAKVILPAMPGETNP